MAAILEQRLTFAMGDGDRQGRSGHAGEQNRRALLDLDHRHAGLELFGAVAHETRPALGAGDQFLELREHLAAVADAEAEGVFTFEEGRELIASATVEERRLGPAAAGTEHVAVGEAAAADQAFHVVEGDTTGEDVAHVHVNRLEAGMVEGRRHFHMAIDALLAQDSHARAHTGLDSAFLNQRRSDVVVDIEGRTGRQPRIAQVEQAVELALGGLGVVAQRLHPVAGLGPGTLGHGAGGFQQRLFEQRHADLIVVTRPGDDATGFEPGGGELRQHEFGVLTVDLNDRAQLLGEQRIDRADGVVGQPVELNLEPATAGEGHLQQRHDQAAVTAVVIGEQLAVGVESLNDAEKRRQILGFVQVRAYVADLTIDLSQRRATETVLAATEIDQDQIALVLVETQLRRQRAQGIGDRGEAGDVQRQRRGDALLALFRLPRGAHGHRILAHRHGNAQRRTEFHADGVNGIEQRLVLADMIGSAHPVGGEFDVGELFDRCRRQVGDRLGHGQARAGRRIDQRDRRALAHRHRLADVSVVARGGHRAVRHRHLPGADHLVASDHAGNRTVADGDQKALGRHRGQPQHAVQRFAQVEVVEPQTRQVERVALETALHLGRLAEQHAHRQIDGIGLEMAVAHGEMVRFGRFADHGVGAAFAGTQRIEGVELFRRDRQHVTLLRFVAPDFQRAHARFDVGHRAQIEQAAAPAVLDQLRQGIGEAAGTHVMDEGDGVIVTKGPAAVDHFLGPAFDFRVIALHRGEIEIFAGGTGGHRRRGAAAQADQHRRAAHHDQLGADRNLALEHVAVTDVAVAAGQHHRLVVTPALDAAGTDRVEFEGAEEAVEVGPAEFVIECRAADRPFEHDVERRLDPLRLAVVEGFPRLDELGDAQVGNGEAGESRLGLATAPRRTFVANLAASAGGRARMRSDRSRMVVGFHLHQDVDRFPGCAIDLAVRRGEEPPGRRPFDDRRVVAVGREHLVAGLLEGVLDHLEQRVGLGFAVDHPIGVEDLVAAVFGVGLGKHHQLDVGRVAPQRPEGLDQIVDLVVGECQSQLGVGAGQRRPATVKHVHRRQRRRLVVREQLGRVARVEQHGLDHAVMQARDHGLVGLGAGRALQRHAVGDTSLDARDLSQPAVVGDIRGLGGPGRDRADAGDDQKQMAAGGRILVGITAFGVLDSIVQQPIQHLASLVIELVMMIDEVDVVRVERLDFGNDSAKIGEQFGVTECR